VEGAGPSLEVGPAARNADKSRIARRPQHRETNDRAAQPTAQESHESSDRRS